MKIFPSDLLVLSLLEFPKTKLSDFQLKWIGKTMEWWAGQEKPETLAELRWLYANTSDSDITNKTLLLLLLTLEDQ